MTMGSAAARPPRYAPGVRIAHRQTDDVVTIVLSDRSPSREGWGAAVRAVCALSDQADRHPHARVLLLSDGGTPALAKAPEAARRLPMAIVAPRRLDPSVLPEGWVSRRVFSPRHAADALAWLQIDAPRARSIATVLPDLSEAAGGWEAAGAVLDALRDIVLAASPGHRVVLERAKVAHELERRLGPQLTELETALAGVAARSGGTAELELDRLSDRIAHANAELDGIVWAMEEQARPWVAVGNYVSERVAELCPDAKCRTAGTDPSLVPGKVALHVLRVVQEAVRNALRHAAAERVDVKLTCQDGAITIVVSDDGRGMSDEARRAAHGGLHNIRARATSCGGSAELTSSSSGTCWQVTLPLGP